MYEPVFDEFTAPDDDKAMFSPDFAAPEDDDFELCDECMDIVCMCDSGAS